jgi:hypothetical protein
MSFRTSATKAASWWFISNALKPNDMFKDIVQDHELNWATTFARQTLLYMPITRPFVYSCFMPWLLASDALQTSLATSIRQRDVCRSNCPL